MVQAITPADSELLLTQLEGLGVIYSPAQARFERITQVAMGLFEVPVATVALVAERSLWFQSGQAPTGIPRTFPNDCITDTLSHGETLVIEDTLLDPARFPSVQALGLERARFYAGHPVFYEGNAVGLLYLLDQKPRTLAQEDAQLLASLAGWVESELKLSALSEAQTQLLREKNEAQRHNLIDPLTKLWNRSSMEYLLGRELSAAQRKNQEVSLMLIDIDYFSALRERYGEGAANTTLKEVAARIRAAVRPHDLLIRHGEDRFLLFAADSTEAAATQLAERMLNQVASQHISDGRRFFSAQVSIGLACARAHQELPMEKLLRGAEQALKEAKGAGRNCVRVVSS